MGSMPSAPSIVLKGIFRMAMLCPRCGSENTKVIGHVNDKRREGIIRQRRCCRCENEWETTELCSERIPKREVVPTTSELKVLRELDKYRSESLKAAKELYYPQSVITEIKNAKTSVEISQIMAYARKKKFG